MQVLKEELRESIRNAAIKTFMEKGYRDASMREIASLADMSVGNLYRYFKNKEEIFGYVVKPLVEMFQKVSSQEQQREFELDYLDVNFLEHSKIIDIIISSRAVFRRELFILFLRADGSPYEGARKTLTEFLEKKIDAFLEKNMEDKKIISGELFSAYTASSIVESFCVILEQAEDKESFVYNMIEFGEYIVKPALRNLLAIKNNEITFRRISDEEINRRFNHHSGDSGNCSSESHGDEQ